METFIIKVKCKFTQEVLLSTGVSENDLTRYLTNLKNSYDMKLHTIEFTAQ